MKNVLKIMGKSDTLYGTDNRLEVDDVNYLE